MAADCLSIREMTCYTGKQCGSSSSLRHVLGLDRGNLHLRGRKFPFSIITYNTALITISYKGTSRSGAISEFVERIKANPPDIVGLCEVFDDDDRDEFRSRLLHIYPYYQEGPDEADIEEDGGLLILSKHSFLDCHHSIYRQCTGPDRFANKGAIYVRIHPQNTPMPCDIFFTHSQNIEESGGKDALYAQLTHLGHMTRAYSDPHTPTIIMGDLNIPAEVKGHYKQMMNRLGTPVDLWLARNPQASGFTNTTNNNFFDDSSDAPGNNHRLDYVLLKSGSRYIPILKRIDILKWNRAGRQISDHFGLRVRFEQLMEVGVDISGSISKISAVVTGFRCIEETDEVGSDKVSFSISIRDQHGRTVKAGTPVTEDVDTGEYHDITSMIPAVLTGDPGAYIAIKVRGTEHDSLLNPDDSLGIKSIMILRDDLLLNKGRSFNRVMPYLTGDGGEYGVEVKVFVI